LPPIPISPGPGQLVRDGKYQEAYDDARDWVAASGCAMKFLRNNCPLCVNSAVIPAQAGIQRPPLDSGFRCAAPE